MNKIVTTAICVYLGVTVCITDYVSLRIFSCFVLVLLAVAAELQITSWRETAERWRGLANGLHQTINELFLEKVDNMLTAYCEATELTEHCAYIRDGKLVMKIGDEDLLVPVDLDYAASKQDIVAALEKAHMEWAAEKKRLEN